MEKPGYRFPFTLAPDQGEARREWPVPAGKDRESLPCLEGGFRRGTQSRKDELTGTTISRQESVAFLDCTQRDFLDEMKASIREGMRLPQKTIPCKYLYDACGSKLFNRICSLPEYYPTRTEMRILELHARDIMKFFLQGRGDLVDIGSGSDLKVRTLLQAMCLSTAGRVRYIPVDISREGLVLSTRGLLRDFPGIEVLGIVGDFTCSLDYLPRGRKLICFFGSTFGNFSSEGAISLLERFTRVMGPDDSLLVGMDMLKPVEVMEAAYNDRSGVTARFNLNTLRHVNEKLHADFNPGNFEHLAFFNRDEGQIEMHLRARRSMEVHIVDIGLRVSMDRGETIRTEISRKFTRTGAAETFARAGLTVENWRPDDREWYVLAQLRLA
jgi:L-histidine Nalpha-methyltransferase